MEPRKAGEPTCYAHPPDAGYGASWATTPMNPTFIFAEPRVGYRMPRPESPPAEPDGDEWSR